MKEGLVGMDVAYDTATLLVIDVQNDFVDGSLPVPGAVQVLSTVNLWVEIFEDLERPIIYSLDWHPASTPHFDRWPVHCVEGTAGAQIHPDVIYDPIGMQNVYTVQKGMGQDDGYSVCSQPSDIFKMGKSKRLQHFDSVATVLAIENTKTVIVVGLATDYCVRQSVLDVLKLGHRVVVILEGIAGVTPITEQEAIAEMSDAGAEFMFEDKITTRVAVPA